MRKSPTKAKITLLILSLAFVCIVTAAGNISLAVNKEAIDKKIEGYFVHDLSFGSIVYIFPNYLIINDVAIEKPGASFTLPRVSTRFSLVKLLLNGFLNVSSVTLFSTEIDYHALSQFLEDNTEQIIQIVKNSPSHDITIKIKETLLDFEYKADPDRYIATSFSLVIRGDSIEGKGMFRADQYQFQKETKRKINEGWPLLFTMKGQLKRDGIDIDRFTLKSGNMYAKWWGGIRGGMLNVNGFTFIDTAKQASSEQNRSFFKYINQFNEDNELSNVNVYVLDIDGQMDLAFPNIVIDHFDFNVNNIPITLKGDISLADPFTMNAILSVHRPYPGSEDNAFFQRADAALTSVWENSVFKTDGHIDIHFFKHSGFSLSPELAKIKLKDFLLRYDEHYRIAAKLTRGDIIYWTNDNEHKISIEDLQIHTNRLKDGLERIEMKAPFYGGSLGGAMHFDAEQSPLKVSSKLVLENVETDELEDLLIHFAKFNGRMSGIIDFISDPELNLSGEISINDGQLTNFDFFNWVGDSFRLSALKAIDFKKATAKFSIDKNRIRLYSIHLKTNDVHIGGYFDVDNHNLVTSKLDLALSQDLLYQSPRFKPILTMFENDQSHLKFVFQLSGGIDSVNFQWLPSEVKQKIQTRIPDFVERMIEQNVDKMLEPN